MFTIDGRMAKFKVRFISQLSFGSWPSLLAPVRTLRAKRGRDSLKRGSGSPGGRQRQRKFLSPLGSGDNVRTAPAVADPYKGVTKRKKAASGNSIRLGITPEVSLQFQTICEAAAHGRDRKK